MFMILKEYRGLAPTYQKTPSIASSEILVIAFTPGLFESLLNRRGCQRLASSEDPHAVLFSERRCAAYGTQSDPIIQAFQLQLVACGKLQYVAHRLREHNPTDLIDS